ncbi:MAG TPA: HDOD domain-containing protein [Humisphaera sp.]
MPDLRDKRVELTLQQLEELPTLPAVAVRVLQATSDDGSSAADVVRLIGSDPSLTARILQLTRRADRGVRDEVATIDRAVVLLGFDAVRNAVLAVSVFQALGTPVETGEPPATRFSREGFWTHCLAVACCAELLAEAGGPSAGVSPSDAFLCGLLHDIGKLALDVALPKSYARVVEAAELLRGNIADVERSVIGVDHLVAGKRLCERWQLPAAVRDVAWLHGQPPEALPASARTALVNLVTLADLLVRQQHLGYSGNFSLAPGRAALLAATGLTPAHVDRALAALVQRMEPRSAALGLGQTTSDDLYRKALAQANHELGRISGQLAAKTKRLTQRSHFFDALKAFQQNLRADASPQQVLAAVAGTAAGMLGTDRAAAFSLAPGQGYAEAVLSDGDGRVVEAALVELPGATGLTGPARHGPDDDADAGADLGVPPPEPGFPVYTKDGTPLAASHAAAPNRAAPPVPAPTGDSPVHAAGDSIEWLTGTLSPKLPGSHRYWICLEAEGVCVGGVVWGGPADEPDRLAGQSQELTALAHSWALALRMSQVRDEARTQAEELADANRRLHAAQDAFLRTRSLTTVGEMAAGAAHEMNNPLAVISGRSQLLAQVLTDAKHRGMAKLIHEQSDRLSDLITELMAFAKPQPAKPLACEPGHLISAALARAKAVAEPADRTIEAAVREIPRVAADEEQVTAAIAEVIANAVQATDPATGRVDVEAGHDAWSDRVVVTVTDNGTGMDEATLRHAFDPFFSAKRAGRRRGMGLAKALRWVEASGGTIKLESRPGEGTRAMVLLPVAPPDMARATGAGPTRVERGPAAGATARTITIADATNTQF